MSDDAQSSFEIGKKLFEQMNYGEAVRLNPDNAEYRMEFSWALLNDKDFQKAIEQATRAIEIDPNMSVAYRSRAWSYVDTKNIDGAFKDITKAIELDGSNPKNYWLRSYIYSLKEDVQNSLLDNARYNDLLGEVSLYEPDEKDPAAKSTLEAVNAHLKNHLYPQIKANGEIIVEYWRSVLIWGRETKQVMLDGTTHKQEHGSLGVGYVCLTDQNLRIVSLGKPSEILEKERKNDNRGVLSFVLGPLREYMDKTKVETTDQLWTVSNRNIKDAQILTDEFLMGKDSLLFIATPLVTYQVYTSSLQMLSAAINMAMSGKFSEIWSLKKVEEKNSKEDVIQLLKNLGNLKTQGIITESEFEEKKKELLARL